MRRQVLTVVVGIALSFLATAVMGYVLYQLSHSLDEGSLGHIARYILQPVVALLVGAAVGALAKARPGSLAALSLIPSVLAFFFAAWRRIEGHFLLFLILEIVCLIVAVTMASVVFAVLERTRRTHREVTLTTNNCSC
jgi:uncharacterized membrane protein YbhN (UPF0104 family)